ncbi:phosphoribosylanthranilate isomerase [Chengkuizengella axinellae]|uniref:N-(5'-phosphoribosyl)anthranilate isomerase n=1 Tax=Chengkuizengella axinellae TaxID=3064388 RepID=A0ABT9IWT3_9BACL|nr:phosphoribosylanthranilate isomerase [Chengkuizengella sp. 2205SS18-9]MDP5273811.1 phosphoribosylanthranilate isomerase [Chengkuizengella sp. 2205SS18-9]
MNKKHTAVKICGILDVPTIEKMLDLPIDYIGFVFAKSRRQVTPEQADVMIQALKKHQVKVPETVGVFVNPDKEVLKDTIRLAPLDVIQLHGQESPAFCKWVKGELGVKVFKVFSNLHEVVSSAENQHQVNEKLSELLNPYLDYIDALMLDTYDPAVGGGTGETFNWELIPIVQQWTKENNIPLLIAGGLDANNVNHLISTYFPEGVDVSSGVETNRIKDIQKIKTFVERVRVNV